VPTPITSGGVVPSATHGAASSSLPLFTVIGDFLSLIFKDISSFVGGGTPLLGAVLAIILAIPLLVRAYGEAILGALGRIKSVSDLELALSELGPWLLGVFGFRRRRRVWGTVYDSVTKLPIDPAIVTLADAATGKEIEEAVTDLAGRYGFLATTGRFIIIPQKTNYSFPSKKALGEKDEIYNNLYHGETIEIGPDSDVVAPNIPMDQVAYDWNQATKPNRLHFHPRLRYFGSVLSRILFWAGFAWTVFALLVTFSPINIFLVALYAAIFIITFLLPAHPLWGRICSREDGGLLQGLVVQVFIPGAMPVVMGRAVSAPDGKFFLKANPGSYTLQVMEMSGDGASKVLHERDVTIGKEGLYNKTIML